MSLEYDKNYICEVLAHLEDVYVFRYFFRVGTFSKVLPKKSSRKMSRHLFQRFFLSSRLVRQKTIPKYDLFTGGSFKSSCSSLETSVSFFLLMNKIVMPDYPILMLCLEN